MAALTVANGVVNFLGDKRFAEKHSRAIADSADAQQAALGEAQTQSDAQAAQAAFERGREATIERGRLAAAISDTGTYGGSLDRVLNEPDVNEAHDIATIEANRVARGQQIGRERVAADANARSQINAIRKPNLLGSALQIGGGLATTAVAARSSGGSGTPVSAGGTSSSMEETLREMNNTDAKLRRVLRGR